jgi:hypothetical protein
MEPSTMTAKQKACKEHLHKHNPTEEGRVVDRHPTKMESIQPGTSHLSAEQGPQATDNKLGQSPKLKVQDHNFVKEHEEINHTKSVRFQEGNKTCHFPPHLAPKENHIKSDFIWWKCKTFQ